MPTAVPHNQRLNTGNGGEALGEPWIILKKVEIENGKGTQNVLSGD